MHNIQGGLHLVTVKSVVVSAVLKFLPDAPADLEPQLGRHRHIAGVEEAMNVPPQETCSAAGKYPSQAPGKHPVQGAAE